MITLIGQALFAGGLTGARPFLTLLVLAVASKLSGHVPPNDVLWLLSPYALVALAVLAYVEHEARTDPDFEQLLARPLQLLAVVAGVLVARLLQPSGDEVLATAGHAGVAAGAGLASLLVGELRRRLFDVFDEALSVEGIYARIEAGGIIGLLLVMVLLPVLASALLLLFTLMGIVLAVGMRGWAAAADRAARVPCNHCQHARRREASRCPACKQAIQPAAQLP